MQFLFLEIGWDFLCPFSSTKEEEKKKDRCIIEELVQKVSTILDVYAL